MELTREQQRAVETIDHNLQLIACAGSGKTEVITRRIAYILKKKPDVRPEHIVAFTFTNKAGNSMKERIQKVLEQDGLTAGGADGMYVGTIHAFCKQLLDRCSEKFRDFQVLDTVKTHLFVHRYGSSCGRERLGLTGGPNDIRLFLECMEKMVDDYDSCVLWTQEQWEVFEQYRTSLYEHGYLDFSLLILETLHAIETEPALQADLKTVRYLVVDEYQDVDDLQEKLIACFARAGANLCVVGDDDQTIYQFRGSNAENMIGFSKRYPDVVQIRLEDNFRCAPEIVDVADTVIRNNGRRLEKRMRAQSASERDACLAQSFYTEGLQYDAIAEEITRRHGQGVPYSEIAILVRKGKCIDSIGEYLRRGGIPYYTDSAKQFFEGNYFHRLVQTLSILHDVDKPALAACWSGCAEGERLNAGFRYLRKIARSGGDSRRCPLSQVLREFAEKIQFLDGEAPDWAVRSDDLEGVCTILDDYDTIYGDQQLSARIAGVLRFLETRAAEEYKYHNFQQANTAPDAVQLMTVHKSKGLEFDTVFLPNLQKGEFPGRRQGGRKYWHVLGGRFEENKDQYASDIDDERKLFYVAVTRAKRKLYLFGTQEKPLSKFVAEAAQSSALSLKDIDRDDLNIALYDIDIAQVRKLILEKVYAGAFSGLKGMFLEADDIRRASPAEILRYAREYNVPI